MITKQARLKMRPELRIRNRKMKYSYFKKLTLPFLPKICYTLVHNYTSLKYPELKNHYYFQLALWFSCLTHSSSCDIFIYYLERSKKLYISRDGDFIFHDSVNFWEETVIASDEDEQNPNVEHWWNNTDRVRPKDSERKLAQLDRSRWRGSYRSATLFTTNPTWSGLTSNPRLRGGSPETNAANLARPFDIVSVSLRRFRFIYYISQIVTESII